MVGLYKRCAFMLCCVLLVGFVSAGDAIGFPTAGKDDAKEKDVKEKIVWVKATDQRIGSLARNLELDGDEPPRTGAEVRLSNEKEKHLQYLANRQGQTSADDYRSVLAEYEADKNVYDIVLFGDSLTYRGDWSTISSKMTIANRGINGDTIDGLECRIDQLVTMQPRALFLLIGINDLAVKMRPEVCESYGRLLDELMRELPDTTIYVESILPVRDDLRKIMSNDAIAIVNKQIKQMADERGLHYIDVYTEMLNPEERRLYYNYQLDGLHLSEQGYDVWEQVIKPYISGVEWQAAVENAEMERSRRRAVSAPPVDNE